MHTYFSSAELSIGRSSDAVWIRTPEQRVVFPIGKWLASLADATRNALTVEGVAIRRRAGIFMTPDVIMLGWRSGALLLGRRAVDSHRTKTTQIQNGPLQWLWRAVSDVQRFTQREDFGPRSRGRKRRKYHVIKEAS